MAELRSAEFFDAIRDSIPQLVELLKAGYTSTRSATTSILAKVSERGL